MAWPSGWRRGRRVRAARWTCLAGARCREREAARTRPARARRELARRPIRCRQRPASDRRRRQDRPGRRGCPALGRTKRSMTDVGISDRPLGLSAARWSHRRLEIVRFVLGARVAEEKAPTLREFRNDRSANETALWAASARGPERRRHPARAVPWFVRARAVIAGS